MQTLYGGETQSSNGRDSVTVRLVRYDLHYVLDMEVKHDHKNLMRHSESIRGVSQNVAALVRYAAKLHVLLVRLHPSDELKLHIHNDGRFPYDFSWAEDEAAAHPYTLHGLEVYVRFSGEGAALRGEVLVDKGKLLEFLPHKLDVPIMIPRSAVERVVGDHAEDDELDIAVSFSVKGDLVKAASLHAYNGDDEPNLFQERFVRDVLALADENNVGSEKVAIRLHHQQSVDDVLARYGGEVGDRVTVAFMVAGNHLAHAEPWEKYEVYGEFSPHLLSLDTDKVEVAYMLETGGSPVNITVRFYRRRSLDQLRSDIEFPLILGDD